jgi:hypothetical protein
VPGTTEQPSVVEDETMIAVDVSEESRTPKVGIKKRTSLFWKQIPWHKLRFSEADSHLRR